MRTLRRLVPSFGVLTSLSLPILGLSLGLVTSSLTGLAGCAIDAQGDDPTTSDPIQDDDATESVCTQGRYRCLAHVQKRSSGRFTALAAPTGYGPPELQSAYKIDPSVIAGSTPPLIAIVDAYGYTAIESDLAVYRSQFGLPACTIASGCLKVVNQQGQTTPLPREPPPNDDWRVETALDLDVASAICPKCKLLVVQADDSSGAGLFLAQNTAVQLGAAVISNSWGGAEDPDASQADIAQLEAFFIHPNVAIFAAAGDSGFNEGGAGPGYPATSANVISVGGTRLVRDTSTRGWSETAWNKGGSACSTWIPKPPHQTASPCKRKATADVAAVGDPNTGVAVYNAANGGWLPPIGGTSAASPLVAALVAATGSGAQASGAFFAANVSKLFDVTSGTNGACAPDTLLCNAAVGWDGPTGYGTPNAKALMPATSQPPASSGDDDQDDSTDVDGGCATSGSGAGLVLGVALLGLRRRRR